MPRGQHTGRNNWNEGTERRLLLIMIANTNVAKDWETVATKMGPSYTASACQQKFGKLKKAIESEYPGTGTPNASTPRKRGRPTAASKGTKEGYEAAEMDDDDDDDIIVSEGEDDSPSKKVKAEGNVIVKKETRAIDLERDDLFEF